MLICFWHVKFIIAMNKNLTESEAIAIAEKSRNAVIQRIVANSKLSFPISEMQALRTRGLGIKTMRKMQEMGLVMSKDEDQQFADDLNCYILVKALHSAGFLNKHRCLEALKSGLLKPFSIRGYGEVLHSKLLKYFKLPPHPKPDRCQCCGQIIRK